MPPSTAKTLDQRISFEFPFENVGRDYAGSLYTRDIYSSNKETYKSYILIFTCAATSNTHLEFVPTESSENSLLALKGSVARKGLPSTFISDNFKTFKAKETNRFALKLKIKLENHLREITMMGCILRKTHWNYKTMFEKGC